jgi:magnesium-protoporphyrin O-methyltransferase
MAGCCDPRGCDKVFGARFARRTASRYRRKGLDRTGRAIVDLVTENHDVRGATVLEIGGGAGEIQLELLKRGAASATNLELSPAYEAEAAALIEQTGFAGRVQRRLVDIAVEPDAVRPADVVVLNRVVCCYPDFPRLLGAAAAHATKVLVFSHPPRNWASRAILATQNLLLRMSGQEFRTFAHPPSAMLAVLADSGMQLRGTHRGAVWRVAAVAR